MNGKGLFSNEIAEGRGGGGGGAGFVIYGKGIHGMASCVSFVLAILSAVSFVLSQDRWTGWWWEREGK